MYGAIFVSLVYYNCSKLLLIAFHVLCDVTITEIVSCARVSEITYKKNV